MHNETSEQKKGPIFTIGVPLLLLILGLYSSSCCHLMSADNPNRSVLASVEWEEQRWFLPSTNKIYGGAVIIHGLNVRPSVMDQLAVLTASHGLVTLRVTLSGHGTNRPPPTDSIELEREVAKAFQRISARVGDLPIIGVGYSFGGLLLTRYAQSGASPRPAAMTLLAPALSLRFPLDFLIYGAVGWIDEIQVPSFTPKPIRQHCSLPAAWYRILRELIQRADTSATAENLQRIPTTILVSPRDELVSSSGIHRWIEKNAGSSWKHISVSPLSDDPLAADHILPLKYFTGAEVWNVISRAVHSAAEDATLPLIGKTPERRMPQ